MKAIIPAAGLATRCLPASKAVPKELFPVFDKPAIQYVVEEIAEAGLQSTVFVTAAGKDAILDHFDTSARLEAKQDLKPHLRHALNHTNTLTQVLSVRQKEPKGVGHAVSTALRLVGDEPFAVMLPDMIIASSGQSLFSRMLSLFNEKQASVIALMKVSDADVDKYGIVEGTMIADGVISASAIVEKPAPNETDSRYAIVGRYLFTPALGAILKQSYTLENPLELTDAMTALLQKEPLYGIIAQPDDLIFDTGDLRGYTVASAYMATRKHPDFVEQLTQLTKRERK